MGASSLKLHISSIKKKTMGKQNQNSFCLQFLWSNWSEFNIYTTYLIVTLSKYEAEGEKIGKSYNCKSRQRIFLQKC